MKKIVVYTMRFCPYCESAKALLGGKGFAFEERLVELEDEATWERLYRETGYRTMPQIFIGEAFVGGYTQLAALDKEGKLDAMVKD